MKHKTAIYYSTNGHRIEVKASELKVKEILASLDKVILYDASETVRLTTVNHSMTPHFRTIPEHINRIVFNNESEEHDHKIEEELENLRNENTLQVYYYNNLKEKTKTKIIRLDEYIWSSEVTRFYRYDLILRHDIIGIKKELNISVKQPEICIEVIDTSFLSEEAFNSLLYKSAEVPFIIFFVFVANGGNYFNTIENNNFRVSCFIKDGKFHYGKNKIRAFTNEHLDNTGNPYSMYSAVKLFIIDKLRKGKQVDFRVLNQICE
ncbi:hypothetical protein AWE51_08780 [Aquimarina aggregata]|uniref:Uncharacterized protein n=1 Tax=Aquimarina aggregata TaxID=1642818 RepID=A0A162ZDS5_9FLAO|nr:hypothetical protein [Aquimarina aggregata]KZS39736.1 hypothetical protein AWE51_08780 [Aquimarina aggregata]